MPLGNLKPKVASVHAVISRARVFSTTGETSGFFTRFSEDLFQVCAMKDAKRDISVSRSQFPEHGEQMF